MKAPRRQAGILLRLLAALVAVQCLGLTVAVNAQGSVSADARGSQPQEGRLKGATPSAEAPFSPPDPVTCGAFAILVDTALVEWQEMQDTSFIIIARAGDDERPGDLSKSRLKDVEDYLKRDTSIKYVMAEGSRAKGLGRVELYVGGRLRVTIPVRKNDKSVCSGRVNPFL